MTADIILSSISRLFADEGKTSIVNLLASCEYELRLLEEHKNGFDSIEEYVLDIKVIPKVFNQIKDNKYKYEKEIQEKVSTLVIENYILNQTHISLKPINDDMWQDKAKKWLSGEGITNQGRVRSDNIAPRSCDGLLFRSLPEVTFYKALLQAEIPFAPLPVFLRGGKNYQRMEPDFVIIVDGITLVVEIDGDTYHNEKPSEAHRRIKMLTDEGVRVERINANELGSSNQADKKVKELLELIKKIKSQ